MVEALRGEVRVEPGNRVVKVNDLLQVNETVSTSDKSFVKLLDSSGGKILVGPKSSIKLARDEVGKISSIDVIKGQIRATFNKKNNGNYKFFVKSKSASMGIRGTDFHYIYNPENNVSTVLTYEGNVEFSEHLGEKSMTAEEFSKAEKVKIPKGHISGVFYHNAKATLPIKISPMQFSLLETNTELIEGSGQKITRPKESKASGNILSPNNEGELSKKDQNIIPVPKKFIEDEYFEDKVKGNPVIKSGGYLDLKTGIYIHPSENSEYDEVNDIYYPAVEFGGIDEESGEYVAPPGLLLHPLKGFMYTTDLLQKGFHNISSTVNNVLTPVGDTVVNVGEKTVGLVKDVATTLRDNTGIVGSTVGKGVELVGSGVSKSLDLAQDTSSLVLNNLANSLNYVLNDTVLTKVKELKEHIPLVNYLKIKFNQVFDYNHTNIDKYNMYDRTIENHQAVSSQTNLDFKLQKSFYTKFFIRPHFDLKYRNYLGDNVNLKSYDQNVFYVGSDFGYSTTVKEMKYQTYFSVEKGKVRKAPAYKNEFRTEEDSWRFGFNKMILGQKMFSTVFGFQYEKYNGRFDGKGKRYMLKVAEILSVDDSKFVRISLDWNKINQEKYGVTNNWSPRLNFYITTLKWNMNFDYWAGMRFLENTGIIYKRRKEQSYFIGGLIKQFENNFSVQFNYEWVRQQSPDKLFDYLSQSFSTGINYTF
jgi:hypothetical protein